MISEKLAKEINLIIAEFSGGSSGIRDNNGLFSALNRPYQTFDRLDLYPTGIEKYAAILECLYEVIVGIKMASICWRRKMIFIILLSLFRKAR